MNNYYVFGGNNIDIQAFTKKANLYESNPSSIKITFGGVGRNIARAIGNYKSCIFVSVFSNTQFSKALRNDLEMHNVDTSKSLIINENKDSIYLDIVSAEGLLVGASDTSLIEQMMPSDIQSVIQKIDDNDYVVVDTNLNRDCFEYILKQSKGYKIVDAVSKTKLEKIKDLLLYSNLIKVNNYEKEALEDVKYNNAIVTYGNALDIFMDGKRYHISHKLNETLNPTGCGDTLLGTFISNLDSSGIMTAIKEVVRAAACSVKILDSVPTKEEIEKESIDALNIKIEVTND